MSVLRFQPGEIALLAVARSPASAEIVGDTVEVAVVGPFERGDLLLGGICITNGDYLVAHEGRPWGLVMDWQLRKLDPPGEPHALIRASDRPARIVRAREDADA